MKALIAGGTGLVGSALLEELLNAEQVEQVEAWGRTPSGRSHPKLTERTVSLEQLGGMAPTDADHLFCCLGTTLRKAGSREAFRLVDFEMVVGLCRFAVASGCRSFNVVSSVGADARSRNFYLRTKGEMEEAVLRSGIPSAVILRPSLLVGKRGAFRFGEEMARIFMMGIDPFLAGSLSRYRSVKATTVAHALFRMALEARPGHRIAYRDEMVKA